MTYKSFFSRIKQDCKELANEFGKRLFYPVQELIDEHLRETRETYVQHFVESFIIGCKMIFGGGVAIIHAVLPFVATHTASDICRQITDRMSNRIKDNYVENEDSNHKTSLESHSPTLSEIANERIVSEDTDTEQEEKFNETIKTDF